MRPEQLLAGYRRAYRDFYRWSAIARGAAGQPTARQAARHVAYAGGWKRLEPLWDLVIRARRVNAMLPLLEATLDAFAGARPSSRVAPQPTRGAPEQGPASASLPEPPAMSRPRLL